MSSDVEILTLRTAWQEYQHIWDLLHASGLYLLPFIFCFLKSIAALYQAPISYENASHFLSTIEIQFFAMSLCVLGCFNPFMTIDLEAERSQASTSSLDECVHYSVKMPLVWAGVMGVSGTFLDILIQELGSEISARETSIKIDAATIKNMSLLLETQSFLQECYWPSIRKYFREEETKEEKLDPLSTDSIKPWPGDSHFLTQAGYYDYFISSTHFAVETLDISVPEEAARLSCKMWWSDPQRGLKLRLIEELKSHIPGLNQYLVNGNWQIFLKKLMHNTIQNGYNSSLYHRRSEHESSLSSFVIKLIGHYGLAREALSFYPFMSVVLEALPLFQALLLMGGVIFYPLWGLFGNYPLKSSMRYLLVWISIRFWTYLWALSEHIDNLLIQAFYPGLSIDWAGKILIDMVTLLMYIVLPLCLTFSFVRIRH